MRTLFLSYTSSEVASAETLRQALEVQGYTCWRAPAYVTAAMYTYPRVIEYGILGSAALVPIWSASAAHDDWVTRHLLFARRLRKPVIPVVLDRTALPNTLIVPASVAGPVSNYDTVAQLLALLPAPQSPDLHLCRESCPGVYQRQENRHRPGHSHARAQRAPRGDPGTS